MLTLSRAEYRDKVYACWLGKNIGGTLGMPYEGRKFVNDLTFYDPVPKKAAANDDLDLQLVWLKLLEERGTDPPLPDFADYWMKYLSAYPWNEYGFCMRNLARGLRPPISGCFENYFVDEMGSPIRSEIWACVAPGDPQLAAAMAWKDSALDHAGGEGMYGEIFWAAVESAAFVVRDPLTLIRIGLAMIPIPCQISRVIREALWCHANGLRWAAARERIAARFGHLQPCNAVPNHGFIILGWLYGRDFGDRLCRAVNCGYDTDCTGGTLGAVLGIIGGTRGIPAKWRRPIGSEIVLHKLTGQFNAPRTIEELTWRTVAVGERVLRERSDSARIGERTSRPPEYLTYLLRNGRVREALGQDVHSAVAVAGDLEITFHYNGEPVLRPGEGRFVRVSAVRKPGPSCAERVSAGARVIAPKGWRVDAVAGEPQTFCLRAGKKVADHNEVTVTIDGRSASFVFLGPGEAKGFPAGDNVPCCSCGCGARQEACLRRRRARGR